MDMGSIAAAAGSLKAAGEIATSLIKLKSVADVQSKAIELNQMLIAAQHEIFAANAEQSKLLQQISKLESEITTLNEWSKTKEKYKLVNAWEGNPAMVYAVKGSCKDIETAH